MFVAICRVDLHLPAAESLKDKRSVVQSATSRIRQQFRLSIAEVDALDRRDLAVLGMAVVSGEAVHAREVLEAAVRYLERTRLDADVGAVEFEILAAF